MNWLRKERICVYVWEEAKSLRNWIRLPLIVSGLWARKAQLFSALLKGAQNCDEFLSCLFAGEGNLYDRNEVRWFSRALGSMITNSPRRDSPSMMRMSSSTILKHWIWADTLTSACKTETVSHRSQQGMEFDKVAGLEDIEDTEGKRCKRRTKTNYTRCA